MGTGKEKRHFGLSNGGRPSNSEANRCRVRPGRLELRDWRDGKIRAWV